MTLFVVLSPFNVLLKANEGDPTGPIYWYLASLALNEWSTKALPSCSIKWWPARFIASPGTGTEKLDIKRKQFHT